MTTALKNRQADLDYRVVAGELESRLFHVKVIHPLVLSSVEAAITPPEYTRRPKELVKEGSFKAIEGSRVQLSVTLNHAPRSASLVLGPGGAGASQTVPMDMDGPRLSALLPPITKDLEYTIEAADADGMKLGADRFRIKVVPDVEPTVRFIQPPDSFGVTRWPRCRSRSRRPTTLACAGWESATRSASGPEQQLYHADRKDEPITAQVLEMLYLEKHKVDYRDGLSYYTFVEDNYPGKPHRVVSELRFFDIFPFKQDYRLIETRMTASRSPGSCSRWKS